LNGGKLKKEIENIGIPVTVFSERRSGSAKLFLDLFHHLRKANVQIVHTHKHKDTILAAPAAKLASIPYVVRTVHGLPEPFLGIQAIKMKLYGVIERMVHRRYVDAMICVSSQIQEKYASRPEVPMMRCIHNGINVDEETIQVSRWQKRQELGVGSETCLIGTVGRLTAVKALPVLLMAAKNLLVQNEKVKVLIVGDGDIRMDLEAQARNLGIADSVVFCGYREDTRELMHAMDIFVLPSLSEGIPMALLEAMATSRATVASRVGGVPEVIDDGVDGFLIEPCDVGDLTEKCLSLIHSPDLAQRMGELARKRVERDFSADEMARRVTSLYQELMHQGGGNNARPSVR